MGDEEVTEAEAHDLEATWLRLQNAELSQQLAAERRNRLIAQVTSKYGLDLTAGDSIVGRKIKRVPRLEVVKDEKDAG